MSRRHPSHTPARTSPLAALLAALAAGALLLGGCASEEPTPKFADAPSASPSAVEQEETAEEFIRRWAREQTEMQKGDTSEYRRIAGDCEPCMVSADLVDEYYGAGGYIDTRGIEILAIEPDAVSKGTRTYTVKVEVAPTEYKERADGSIQSMPGGRSTYSVVLTRAADQNWKFANFLKVPE